MDTLSQVMEKLRKEGYTENLVIDKDCLACREGKFKVYHDEFVIDKFYRFEGDSNPADEATLYAISSDKHNVKGLLVNGGGIYTDDITDDLLKSLNIKRR